MSYSIFCLGSNVLYLKNVGTALMMNGIMLDTFSLSKGSVPSGADGHWLMGGRAPVHCLGL